MHDGSADDWRILMSKIALAAIAAVTLWSTQASAYDWRYHHWGNGRYDIVRWTNGDCKIWHDDTSVGPVAPWVGLWRNIPTHDRALVRLRHLQDIRACNL
jgi:hypothetical protein